MFKKIHRSVIARAFIALVLLTAAFIPTQVHATKGMAEGTLQAADGDLDTTFGTGGIVTTDFNGDFDFGSSVVLQPDGKVVVVGWSIIDDGSNTDFVLARYMPDGSLDPTFDSDGKVITDFTSQDDGYAVALQADGKILLAGTIDMSVFALVRYNSDGSLDTTFDNDGIVTTALGQNVRGSAYTIAVQLDEKIVLAGQRWSYPESDFALVRYNNDGSLDAGFGGDGIVTTDFGTHAVGNAIVIQPTDGKIIVAGESGNTDNKSITLARYNSDGSLDTMFDSDGKVITSLGTNDIAEDLTLQPDGKILAAGSGNNSDGDQDFVVVRYNSDGSLDTTFGLDGRVLTDFGSREYGRAVAVQPDGRILMTGAGNDRTTLALARYQSNGALDASFGVNGKVFTDVPDAILGFDLALQPDHNIIIVGGHGSGDNSDFAVARYINHSAPRTLYVKENATGANNGTSWADAYTDLQSALAAANNGDGIWVAQGTYKPTTGTDRTTSFVLKNGVKILGGFLGWEWESGDPRNSERDPVGTATILSGDIGTEGQKNDNSYHVVVASGVDSETVLDGLIITDGNASGEGGSDSSYGGGIYSYKSSPTLDHVTLDGNYGMYGGGMYITGDMYSPATPALTNVTFNANAAGEGGGMYNFEYSNPVLKKVTFSSNTAERSGGGMMSMTSTGPVLTDVTFSGNTAGLAAGGMGNFNSQASLNNVTFKGNSAVSYGGAIVNALADSTFINVTIGENSAAWGGGMWNSSSHPTLTNVTFKGNTASTSGGGIYSEANNNLTVRNTILWGNTAPTGAQIHEDGSISTISDSVVQGGFAGGTNIITGDPKLGLLAMSGGFTETVSLQAGSSAINAGNDDICPPTDQRGVKRSQGSHCDIGAYEAGSLIVTKTADTNDGYCDSDCSLREAIEVAPAGGMITFNSSLSGQTISLGSTLLVYKDLSIDGSTLASKISVSGNDAVTVFETTPGATATLKSLIVTNGRASGSLYGEGYSGGINNFGALNIVNSTISHNGSALSEQGNGGGIFNSGSLNITGSLIASNFAQIGGGICNSGDLKITDSTISDNEGLDVGGILNWGTLTVTNTTISNNSSSYEGGGVQNQGIIHISNSTISGNKAGYSGGGLSTNGETRIINSTFFNNSAALEGGGIFGRGSLTIVNSTISGNSAGTVGGGIHNTGTLKMINTILANSISGSDCYNNDSTGVIGENSKNLIETNAAAPNNCGTPVLTSNPMLGPLAGNGGPTQTMALLAGSPAIDTGDDASCPAADQRGITRPYGTHCDIGAYEKNGGALPAMPTFTDVPKTHRYWQDIEILYANGLTGGCSTSPLKFCPDQTMSRGEAAVFMLRGTFGSSYVPPVPTHIFQDNWSKGPWAEPWAEGMRNEGLSAGCLVNPPKYCPWDRIPREQAVIFALRMKYGTSYVPPPATGTLFADMTNPGYYATSWAEQAYKDGLIPNCGMSGGKPKICPKDLVSRGLAAYMIVRAKNLSMP